MRASVRFGFEGIPRHDFRGVTLAASVSPAERINFGGDTMALPNSLADIAPGAAGVSAGCRGSKTNIYNGV